MFPVFVSNAAVYTTVDEIGTITPNACLKPQIFFFSWLLSVLVIWV